MRYARTSGSRPFLYFHLKWQLSISAYSTKCSSQNSNSSFASLNVGSCPSLSSSAEVMLGYREDVSVTSRFFRPPFLEQVPINIIWHVPLPSIVIPPASKRLAVILLVIWTVQIKAVIRHEHFLSLVMVAE